MAIAPQNTCIPYYEQDALTITAFASAAVTGKRLVSISAPRQAGPGLNASTTGGNITVAHTGAGLRHFGVASSDAPINSLVTIIVGPGTVLPVTCSANITAGVEVEATANGQIQTLASGKAVGLAVDSATSGNDCAIKLY